MQRILPLILALVVVPACRPDAPAPSAQIHLEVTDGPAAGRYVIRARADACSPDLTGRGSLGIRYTDLDSGAPLASLQLVMDADTAFYLGLVFDGLQTIAPEQVIETRPGREPRGAGSARLVRRSDTSVLHVAGRTAAGVSLAVRVRCPSRDSIP